MATCKRKRSGNGSGKRLKLPRMVAGFGRLENSLMAIRCLSSGESRKEMRSDIGLRMKSSLVLFLTAWTSITYAVSDIASIPRTLSRLRALRIFVEEISAQSRHIANAGIRCLATIFILRRTANDIAGNANVNTNGTSGRQSKLTQKSWPHYAQQTRSRIDWPGAKGAPTRLFRTARKHIVETAMNILGIIFSSILPGQGVADNVCARTTEKRILRGLTIVEGAA